MVFMHLQRWIQQQKLEWPGIQGTFTVHSNIHTSCMVQLKPDHRISRSATELDGCTEGIIIYLLCVLRYIICMHCKNEIVETKG